MGKNRYYYDSKGRLKGYSSDQSPLLRFLISLPFLAAFFVVVALFGARDGADGGDIEGASSDSDEVFRISGEMVGDEDNSIAEPLQESAPPQRNSEGISELPDDDIDGAIQAAMREAYSRGEPVRWKEGGEEGYAIPSPENSQGCRNVYYSVDSRDGWQSPQTTICP